MVSKKHFYGDDSSLLLLSLSMASSFSVTSSSSVSLVVDSSCNVFFSVSIELWKKKLSFVLLCLVVIVVVVDEVVDFDFDFDEITLVGEGIIKHVQHERNNVNCSNISMQQRSFGLLLSHSTIVASLVCSFFSFDDDTMVEFKLVRRVVLKTWKLIVSHHTIKIHSTRTRLRVP